jgi:hypothetical protein
MARAKNTAASAEKKTTSRTKKTAATVNGTNGGIVEVRLSEEQIRQRAYELYENRGRQDGAHESDWFAAEAELRSRTA